MTKKQIQTIIDNHIQGLALKAVAELKLEKLNDVYKKAIDEICDACSVWFDDFIERQSEHAWSGLDICTFHENMEITPLPDTQELNVKYRLKDRDGDEEDLTLTFPYKAIFNTKSFIKRIGSEEQKNQEWKDLIIEMAERCDTPDMREQLYIFLKQEQDEKDA